MITSPANTKIKNVIKLQKKSRERKQQGVFVAEGIRMFREAPEELVREVYVSKSLFDKGILQEDLQVKLQAGKLEIVEDAVFDKISDTRTPQGILSVLRMPQYDLEKSLADADGIWLILEDIQDPGNLGTILRTAEGAGIEGVILTENTVDLFNPKTIRSTMGSLYRVPFFVTADIETTMGKLKEQGFAVYAAHLDGQKYYDEITYSGKTAFLIGNEGNGLRDATARLATDYLKIPMEGKVESLNAAIASSLLMYEAYRQRRCGGKR